MNYKDEREYLENELRSYRKIIDMCYRYEQEIEEAQIAKYGISSASYKDVIYENASDPYKVNINALNESIKLNTVKLQAWQHRKEWIEERLSVLDEKEYKVIKYKYIVSVKATNAWIASVLPCHENTIKHIIDRSLEKMLKFVGNHK